MLLKAAKREKLRQLREARQAGTSLISYSDDEDETGGIYDEVDEETYRKHKRKQLMNDDFIVDDDGEGYVDNGVDEWDERSRPAYYSDEEEVEDSSKGNKKRSKKRIQKVTKTAQISNYFKPSDKKSAPSKKVDANIDDILDEFQESTPSVKRQKTNVFTSSKSASAGKVAKKSKFDFSTVKSEKPKRHIEHQLHDDFPDLEAPSSPPEGEATPSKADQEILADDNKIKMESTEELVVKMELSPEDSDEDSEDDIVIARKPRASAVNKNKDINFSSVKAPIALSSSPSRPTNHQTISHTVKLDESKVVPQGETEDSFKMFWLDYCEVDDTLLLFGKIKTIDGELVSGVVQVNGLYREIYFLPRKYRLGEEESEKNRITPRDVHKEIAPLLLEQYDLDELKAKPETMKYAFELPDIPKETEYLKVILPFKTSKNRHLTMPSNLEGETFFHVFGTNTNIFESFVMQRNIMGPCWLEISNGDFNAIQNTSHCQVEVVVSSPGCVKPLYEHVPPPPSLTVTSIGVQTLMNAKENRQEVVSVSIATYRDLQQDVPIDGSLQPNELITLVRPVGSVAVPPGLQQMAQKQNINVKAFPNEKVLLNCLSALIKNADPDVFVGHRLENISLDVLVHRMHDLKITTWSTFGRRNRKAWPDRFGRNTSGFNNNLQIREIFQGRLLCDIANEMGQSLTLKCQSWDLPEMYDVVCHKKLPSLEINFQNPKYSDDANFLLMALKENATNVKVTAEIAFTIQVLSLSKQLTNIAGNAWSHTLSGTRAGRNEFILLHEFRKNNYIVPDKEDKFHRNTNYQQQARLESADDDSTTITSNKKPKYQGGLVFEPEKGLHKNYILVMDFNSLYPSIIQEFNICFTTVDRDKFNNTLDEDRDMPTLPSSESSPGVLPRLLNTLVSRRGEVKKLLKDPSNTPFQRAQYDIKQHALKLTANSMYGCLGYVNSRFYAKPLAMLVTNKGREILMDTRQLAESIGLRVVYGDTDSVMIDTGVDDYDEAIKIGEQFKLQVNERYKLLEIDIDNIFKRLLLHAKKKYAAMNATLDRKTGEVVSTLEVKGLDMRRREYCQLSKDISTFILNKILSDLDPEQALSDAYNYLEEMTTKIRSNEIKVDKFKINTRLSKDPKNYPNGKTMPPVQVALRLREQGKVIKAGSVITYVVTAPVSEDDKSSPAERSRAIQELYSNEQGRKPDANFYLEKQIFAPVERLLERIDGVDITRVASSLGIDTKKYVLKARSSEASNGELLPFESNISDTERFRQTSYFVMECKCGNKFRFGGIQASQEYKVTFNGISCMRCEFSFPLLKINAQLEYTIRKHIALYYAGWLVCDDSACGITTRQISVYGKRCIGASGTAKGCKGIMRYKYSDKALYNQLLYLQSIFDVDKAKKTQLRPIYDSFHTKGPAKLATGQLEALAEQNRELFSHCQEVVQKYLTNCGRRYVDMGAIFEFMAYK
ncbi:uncharacterized protein PRCAT00002861001 [Priceomyces carsonii]|uniref:uncharacterized protein n=1 Tax=Priceomyces carsonii TaxID=28549 RepID=UPI002EDB485F|nr:unnamed protein product [Priceomyces carsonii]